MTHNWTIQKTIKSNLERTQMLKSVKQKGYEDSKTDPKVQMWRILRGIKVNFERKIHRVT